MTQSTPFPEKTGYYGVLAISFATFVFNTSEFIPIALLSDIGASLGKSVQDTGIMMTVYAWIVALTCLPLMLATAKMERKKLLITAGAVFVVSHIITVIATNFTMLLIARSGVALSHAIFWSINASIVVRLAPKGKEAAALGMIATGLALAAILGLPLGRLLGQYLGWRTTFGVLGGLAFVCILLFWRILPTMSSENVGSADSLPELIKNKALLIVYIAIALSITAHFTAYSYIEPFMLKISRLSNEFATTVLFIFGMAGMIGSFLFGRYYERFKTVFLFSPIIVLMLSLLVMAIVPNNHAFWMLLGLLWGIGFILITLVFQLRTLNLAPNYTDVAMSIFSGIYNLGIGGGALLGNIVINHYGLNYIGYVGAMICVLLLSILLINIKTIKE